jgi:hypothetical protein
MAGSYKPGQKYLQHRITGAVFQWTPEIDGATDLVEMLAGDDGNLTKVEPRVAASSLKKLNPTKTPEKRSSAPMTTNQNSKRPTLSPTDK